jgi:integrase
VKGSIRKRGTTYTAYWSTTDPATGKRRQHSKGGFKLKETSSKAKGESAREFLNIVMGKVQEGSWRPDKPLTVKQLLKEHWLPAQKAAELRPTTLVQYEGIIDNWIVPHIGAVKVAALTPVMVTNFTNTLRTSTTAKGRDGLSIRSTQMAVGVLKAGCAWALVNGYLGRNPVLGVKRPKLQSVPMASWSNEQAKTFLEYTKEDRLSFAWWLLLARGLRRGEICGLRWDDVDLDGQVIRINRTRVTVEGRVIDSVPKTEAGRRSIPLDPSLVATLRKHKSTQASESLAAGPGAYTAGGHLLADELGRPYHPDSISGWFDQKVKDSGLQRIRLHDTRHTAASLMLASGTPVKVVSDMLGHASPTITLSTYAHVLPNMAEEAGAALSARLLG